MQDFEKCVLDLRNKIVEALARKNEKEVIIASTVYKGGKCSLTLRVDGNWHIQSPMGGYVMYCGPGDDRVLEKFTKLTDQNFNITVGDLDFYDEMETYLKKVSGYVKRNKSFLSERFLEALQESLKKVSQ